VAGVPGVPNALGTNFSSSSMVLARYTPTGHLDNTFGTNGIVSTSVTPGPISFGQRLDPTARRMAISRARSAVRALRIGCRGWHTPPTALCRPGP